MAGFYFGSMPAEQAGQAKNELPKFAASEVNDWKGLIKVFRSMGLDKSLVDRYEAAWSRWIEFAATGRVTISPWTEFDFPRILEENLQKNYNAVVSNIVTDLGKKVLTQVLEHRYHRSDVALILYEYLQDAQNPEETTEIVQSHQAKSHECNRDEITYSPNVRPFCNNVKLLQEIQSQNNELPSCIKLEMPDNFLRALGKLDTAKMNALISDQVTKSYLHVWYENTSFTSLKEAIDRLVKGVDDEEEIAYASTVVPNILSTLKYFVRNSNAATGYVIGGKVGAEVAMCIQFCGDALVNYIAESIAKDLKQQKVVRAVVKHAKKIVRLQNN